MTERQQATRRERAKGLRVIKPDGENHFLVESSKKDRMYRVQFENGNASCTCPDFLNHWVGNDWRCKHIIAVEDMMERVKRGMFERPRLNREMLEKPFDPDQIRQREGIYGDVLDYVEGHAVIQRLNEAFDGDWSFEVMSHEVKEKEVVVLGKLTACGIAKMQFGSSEITKDEETGEVVSLGDDLKAAATDALKKAATLFGVGLHLYENRKVQPQVGAGEEKKPEAPQAKEEPKAPSPPAAPSGDGRLTNKQLAAIYGLAQRKGLTRQQIEQRTIEVYNKRPDYLTKQEASAVIQQLESLPSPS